MSFKKGKKKSGGRAPGTPNKITKTVKETFAAVFADLQDDPKNNLIEFAKKYPRDFYQLAAKLIPLDINASVNKIKVNITND